MDVGELRRQARAQLRRRAPTEFAGAPGLEPREATLLLARVLGWSEAQVLAHPEAEVAEEAASRFSRLLDRRLSGEPFAYLVGEREFFGRSFCVDRRVLIPRPETEHLVEAALARRPAGGSRVLDIGTGSGCIALTVALERPDLEVWGSDRSVGALAVAMANRARWELGSRVRLLASDLLEALAANRFDLVLSNPPYVAETARPALQREVREHEPTAALFSGAQGLDTVRRLLESAPRFAAGATLLMEIGAGQLDAVRELAATRWRLMQAHPDYAGVPRIVELRRR